MEAFRTRRLDHVEFPYVYLDATYLNVRNNLAQPASMATVVATGITADGNREVLGCDVGDSETEALWQKILASLRDRGLGGVRLVISDAHRGLAAAADRWFQGAAQQRCRVHFIRNLLAAVPRAHWQKIWSTNPLERINKEIKRRSRVVGIFPNEASAIRLAGAILADLHDEWQATDRRYLSEDSIASSTPSAIPSPPPNSQSATITEAQLKSPPLDGTPPDGERIADEAPALYRGADWRASSRWSQRKLQRAGSAPSTSCPDCA